MQDMTTTIAGGVALGFPALKVIIRILAKATSRLLGLSKLEMGLVPGWSVLSFVYMWIHHFRDHPHYPAAPVIDVRVEANQEECLKSPPQISGDLPGDKTALLVQSTRDVLSVPQRAQAKQIADKASTKPA